MNTNPPDNLILFDGVCNLCSASVQFIIERDKKGVFTFASLQSDIGKRYLSQAGLPDEELNTFLLVEKGKIYTQSDAALRIVRCFGWQWKWLYGFTIAPRFIRNGVYNFIAQNRYRWFGKKAACWLPTPELKSRFIT